MTTVAQLEATLTLKTDEFDRGVQKAHQGMEQMGQKADSTGNIITGILSSNVITAGFNMVTDGVKGAVDANSGFEARLSSIKAVSGASAEDMAQLSAKALQLGKDTSFSAGEAAAGME